MHSLLVNVQQLSRVPSTGRSQTSYSSKNALPKSLKKKKKKKKPKRNKTKPNPSKNKHKQSFKLWQQVRYFLILIKQRFENNYNVNFTFNILSCLHGDKNGRRNGQCIEQNIN